MSRAVLFLANYMRDAESAVHRDICIFLFTEAIFKEPRCKTD